jgi:tryptophan synthase beta chain
MTTSFHLDQHGYFGEFGGAFVPEMLRPNVQELQREYLRILEDREFQSKFRTLLRDYVGRPTPLTFAARLSKKLGSPIYLKREDLNHTGSHKINNAIGQILLAQKLGKRRIIAETGAGQHGVATATVCALMNLECVVYMGEVDMQRQAPNVGRMRMLGAEVRSVTSGSRTLKDAANEALRDWIANPTTTHYLLGSAVGPHPYPDLVARLQSIISEEIRDQFHKLHQGLPPRVIACVGGGSNAIGAFYHFLDSPEVELFGVEAAGEGLKSGHSAATLALGAPGVLHGSYSIVMQDGDGQISEAHSISAGLDYPGIGPQHAALHAAKRVQYLSITDNEALRAAQDLAQLEGIIPALESAHALAALQVLPKSSKPCVVCLSGRGDKDMECYLRGLAITAGKDS